MDSRFRGNDKLCERHSNIVEYCVFCNSLKGGVTLLVRSTYRLFGIIIQNSQFVLDCNTGRHIMK